MCIRDRPKLRELAKQFESGKVLPDSGLFVDTAPPADWDSFLDANRLSNSQFGVLSGTLSEDGQQFTMLTSFEGTVPGEDSERGGLKTKQKLLWQKDNDQWRISQWDQVDFKTIEPRQPIFQDVTDSVIPSAATRADIYRSFHIDMMLKEAARIDYPEKKTETFRHFHDCLLYTSPSPRDATLSRMPSSA